jgi:hypothetical protein
MNSLWVMNFSTSAKLLQISAVILEQSGRTACSATEISLFQKICDSKLVDNFSRFLVVTYMPKSDKRQKSYGTQHTCRKVSEHQHLQQVFIIHRSGSHDHIHLQKTLGHIHNYHILMTQANSSYECHGLKLEDRWRL